MEERRRIVSDAISVLKWVERKVSAGSVCSRLFLPEPMSVTTSSAV